MLPWPRAALPPPNIKGRRRGEALRAIGRRLRLPSPREDAGAAMTALPSQPWICFGGWPQVREEGLARPKCSLVAHGLPAHVAARERSIPRPVARPPVDPRRGCAWCCDLIQHRGWRHRGWSLPLRMRFCLRLRIQVCRR